MKLRTIIYLLIGAIAMGIVGCDRILTSGERVERVSDGDTIRIQGTSGKTLSVRFACIDAPEIPHSKAERNSRKKRDRNQFAWGRKAQARLEQLIKQANNRVKLTIVDRDRYGRTVAEVRLPNGTLTQQVLLTEGLAKVYQPYLKKCPSRDILKQAQAKAEQSKIGIWKDKEFINPWKWRSLNKK